MALKLVELLAERRKQAVVEKVEVIHGSNIADVKLGMPKTFFRLPYI
jgi:hypothetical protein